jgi:hypothetical protein
MKKIVFVALIFLIACKENSTTTPTTTKHFSSTVLRMAFDYPATWTIRFNPDSLSEHAIVTLLSPLEHQNDNYQENITITKEAFPVKLSDSLFHKATLAELKISNPTLQFNDDGKKGKYLSHHFSFVKDSVQYVVYGYNVLKDSTGYTINFTTPVNNENALHSTVQAFLNSFNPL